jgi:hypothetical protein
MNSILFRELRVVEYIPSQVRRSVVIRGIISDSNNDDPGAGERRLATLTSAEVGPPCYD